MNTKQEIINSNILYNNIKIYENKSINNKIPLFYAENKNICKTMSENNEKKELNKDFIKITTKDDYCKNN